jgi:hypothetical protein
MLRAVLHQSKDGNRSRPAEHSGSEALDTADLMIIFMRWLDLPDEQLKHIVRYVESGRPIIGMRTATHSFNVRQQRHQRYTWDSKEWDGGSVVKFWAETGGSASRPSREAKRGGVIAPGQEKHPVYAAFPMAKSGADRRVQSPPPCPATVASR